MQTIHTEILVIGGGATGTGILRDLAMRGFQSILVERRDLTHGTTGRFHGLLHSGGRYAVKDPEAARECIEENRILRKIMPHCIEDTGGYFICTTEDDPNYANLFLSGCRKAGIPTEEIPIHKMLANEPHLNPEISQCFQVPDAAADGFAAAHANIASALEYGAKVLTYHQVTQLLTTDNQSQATISGALCHDLVRDQPVEIHADLVINAAGAWVGKISATAGLEIAIRPGKGTMIAVNHRIVNTVINRLKMPSDGDILVPAHTVAVMGTTDEQVPDPDIFSIEPWEVQLMLSEGEKIIPGFSQLRMLRAWAGVRPLYQETRTDQSRDITRSFVLLDHEVRDGVPGLLTITSGKWTTYRKMAEVTVDKICEKLGTERKCRTHLEELPNENKKLNKRTHLPTANGKRKEQHQASHIPFHILGQRLAQIEHDEAYGQLICECELATRTDIEDSIIKGQAKTLDDIRRDIRLGMGPCQGGFCTFRAAGILHQVRGEQLESDQGLVTKQATESPQPVLNADPLSLTIYIRDFLQERWKGLLPILWGQQLRQERLNELIYLNVLNIDHLPSPAASRLGSQNYLEPTSHQPPAVSHPTTTLRASPTTPHNITQTDTLIIGGGLAGLTAAWQIAAGGQKVRLITKGWGATHWSSGCIDLLGYYPISNPNTLQTPVSALARLAMEQPDHPYAQVSMKQIDTALTSFQDLCAEAGYPLLGSLESNWLLPTSAGALRPTCQAPETFVAGDLSDLSPMLLVGIKGFNDFYPHLAAANLKSQGFPAEAVIIQLPGLENRQRIDAMVLARYFNDLDTVIELAEAIKPHIGGVERIGLPAVLGISDALGFVRALESILDRRIFEIPGLPPSVPGIRLHQILVNAIQKSGGQIFHGLEAISYQPSSVSDQIESIFTEAAARPTRHTARNFVLATGGILGGGITTDHSGAVFDPILDLPLQSPTEMGKWMKRDFLHPEGHPIMRAGILTKDIFKTRYKNLFAIGDALPGDFLRERSLEGVALVSGYQVGEFLA